MAGEANGLGEGEEMVPVLRRNAYSINAACSKKSAFMPRHQVVGKHPTHRAMAKDVVYEAIEVRSLGAAQVPEFSVRLGVGDEGYRGLADGARRPRSDQWKNGNLGGDRPDGRGVWGRTKWTDGLEASDNGAAERAEEDPAAGGGTWPMDVRGEGPRRRDTGGGSSRMLWSTEETGGLSIEEGHKVLNMTSGCFHRGEHLGSSLHIVVEAVEVSMNMWALAVNIWERHVNGTLDPVPEILQKVCRQPINQFHVGAGMICGHRGASAMAGTWGRSDGGGSGRKKKEHSLPIHRARRVPNWQVPPFRPSTALRHIKCGTVLRIG
ncbi:hypothetical protein B0H10DRAFT_1958518 [Mycena sp. CBHHK59/15]|nr:hypothetical protein B0H10DRAFT_1958518 [Mycena sp. CBHHK59/15]